MTKRMNRLVAGLLTIAIWLSAPVVLQAQTQAQSQAQSQAGTESSPGIDALRFFFNEVNTFEAAFGQVVL